MVAIKKQFESDPQEWWAFSPSQGWVVLDKTLPHNLNTYCPEEFEFVRGGDGSTYEQGEQAWDYKEARRYLDSLSPVEALRAEKELAGLQHQFREQLAA